MNETQMNEMRGQEMDYHAMYLRMVNAAEDAINLLIEAQRDCENMYLGVPSGEEMEEHAEYVFKRMEAENPEFSQTREE